MITKETQQATPGNATAQLEKETIPDSALFNGLLHVELFITYTAGRDQEKAEIHVIYNAQMFRIKACSASEATLWLRRGQPAHRLIVWKRYPDDTLSGIYSKLGYRIPDWVEHYEARLAQAQEGIQP
jgi:hypothetical protein